MVIDHLMAQVDETIYPSNDKKQNQTMYQETESSK